MFVSIPTYGQHGWPIDPMNQGHPIGNSFGEFQDFGSCLDDANIYLMPNCIYHHTGIDILGAPMYESNGKEDPTAPWVRMMGGGVAEALYNMPNTNSNFTTIRDAGGVIHRYGHLEYNSYSPMFVIAYNNQTKLAEGSAIAKLYRWNDCDYHHLHHEMEENGRFLNVLARIAPHSDLDPPEIAAIIFAKNNSVPWRGFERARPDGCTVVSGEVDILAEIRDRDRAGSSHPGTETLWVYDIRWRACPESNPNCQWINTYRLDEIPTDWGIDNKNNPYTSAYFSVDAPWVSDSDYCRKTSLYVVLTNFKGGLPDKDGCWNTGKIPDGNYVIGVEATDFAGNTVVSSAKVCVRNGGTPGSPKDLRIR